MKRLLSAAILSCMISAPLFADDQQTPMMQNQGMGGGMMMGMMNRDQMMAMHSQMNQMQALMAKIHEEKDPNKRRELMQQHMAMMQSGMRMMMGKGGQGMMGGNMGKGGAGMNGNGMMGDKDKSAPMMDMSQRMDMMQERMNMMQMMMEQMMDHDAMQQGHHGKSKK